MLNVHTVTYGDKHKLVQIGESTGRFGEVSFNYEAKATMSPQEAYFVLLGLAAVLQNECGYTLSTDTSLQNILKGTGKVMT